MIPALVGVGVWVWSGWWPFGLAASAAVYAVQCLVFPYRRCWRCGATKWRGDGKGNLRPRNCWACKGKGFVRRWGAVLIGMVKP